MLEGRSVRVCGCAAAQGNGGLEGRSVYYMAGLCFYVVKFACMSSILLNKIHKPASKET